MTATIRLAVLAVWMALAPGANAHSEIHGFAAAGLPHEHALPSVNPPAVTGTYALSFSWESPDGSCHEPGHEHADHIGCCAGMASCASGGGAVIVPEQGPDLLPRKAILHFSIMPVSLGVKILPTDPPPRASI